MFSNVVLDVFLGLVLMYLLYSLFITILSEMIATWMNLRARILRVSIEKMLNDGLHAKLIKTKSFWQRTWNIVQRFFLKEFDDFKYSLAGKFYECTAIKYLSDNGGEKKTPFTQTKPSYISAEMFADTLIQLLKDKAVGATEMDKVNFCLNFNTHRIEPDTLKNLRDHAEKAGSEINILKERFIAWYNETQDRATGWYKKKVQLMLFWLGLIVAIIFNVDTIQIAKILSKDKEARGQLANMAVAFSKDSSKYKDFIYLNGDTIHPKAILDSGFKHVSKDIDDANMVLGLGWSLGDLVKDETKNIDSAKDRNIYILLSNYQTVFNGFDSAIGKLKQSISVDIDHIKLVHSQLAKFNVDTAILKLRVFQDSIVVKTDSMQHANDLAGRKTDSLNKKNDSIYKARDSLYESARAIRKKNLDSLSHLYNSIVSRKNNLIDSAKSGLAQKALMSDSADLKLLLERKSEAIRAINELTFSRFKSIDKISFDTIWEYKRGKEIISDPSHRVNQGGLERILKSPVITVHTLRPYTAGEKIWYVISNYHPFTANFWSFVFSVQFIGLFITALMLSLGSPFWFDLLKKLVALRGAGVKPEEKKVEDNKNTKQAFPEKKDDEKADAGKSSAVADSSIVTSINELKLKYKDNNEIVSIEQGFIKQNNIKQDAIEFHIRSIAAQTALMGAIGTTYNKLPVNYLINDNAKVHSARCGDSLYNSSMENGSGTLGCFLSRANSNKQYLISCWHVLKGNHVYNDDSGPKIINDSSQNQIASLADGCISDKIDIGFAEMESIITEQDSLNNNKANGIKSGIRAVIKQDAKNETRVKFKGGQTGAHDNDTIVIYNHSVQKSLDYLDNTSKQLIDLFSITVFDQSGMPTAPSREGDSGSVVVDDKGAPLGLVVGGDKAFTYVIKFSNALEEGQLYHEYSITI